MLAKLSSIPSGEDPSNENMHSLVGRLHIFWTNSNNSCSFNAAPKTPLEISSPPFIVLTVILRTISDDGAEFDSFATSARFARISKILSRGVSFLVLFLTCERPLILFAVVDKEEEDGDERTDVDVETGDIGIA